MQRLSTFSHASLSDGSDNVFSSEAMTRTVGYLARYARRVAISNDRLISLEDGQVRFYYKDYRDNRGQGPPKVKQLPVVEFIDQFLQHVMPNGFRSSRNCGYLGNSQRKESLAAIREQLGTRADVADEELQADEPDEEFDEPEDESSKCPQCGHGETKITGRMRRPTVNEIYIAPWQSLLSKDAVIEPDPALDTQFNAQFEFW